jgi:NADH dehydrogenase
MEATDKKRVIIVGGGFAGINCAKALGGHPELEVVLIDRRNYHLFQPLLYQVAMAGLSPCDIATPIRGLMSHLSNVYVVQGEVERIDPLARQVHSDAGVYGYDYLVLASGAQHAYFGQEHWEEHAPGLKTLEQATEVRRRVLSAFERAECERDSERRRALLTFVVVGGGPTGVELAGRWRAISATSIPS